MIDYINRIIYVDNTTLSLFGSCKEKCRLGGVRGYRKRVQKPSLSFGHAIHAAIAGYYNAIAGGWQDETHRWNWFDESQRNIRPINHAKVAFLRDLGYTGANIPVALESEERRSIERGLAIVEAYFERYADDPYDNILKPSGEPLVEVGFRYPLTRFADYEVVYVGYIDRIMRSMRTNEPKIFETKTTTRSLKQYVLAANPNRQLTGYFPAARGLVPEIRECLWDMIFVSNRAADMRKALTDRFAMWGVSQDDFLRHPVTRTSMDISEFMLDAEEDALEYCRWITSEKARWTRNTSQCSIYGGCEFRQRCCHNVLPEDEDRFMSLDFEVNRWEPWVSILRKEEEEKNG